MVHGQPVRHPGTPVVGQHRKALKAHLAHQAHLVLRHAAFGISDMVQPALGLGRIAIASQISRHHREVLRQRGGHFVPNGQGLRMPVQQEQARPLATQHGRNRHAGADLQQVVGKTGKQRQGRVVHGQRCV